MILNNSNKLADFENSNFIDQKMGAFKNVNKVIKTYSKNGVCFVSCDLITCHIVINISL